MRLVRFPGGAVGEIPDPPEPLPPQRDMTPEEQAAYTDFRKRHATKSSTEEPPADDELTRLRSSMAAAGYDMKKMSAAEEPPELKEALLEYAQYIAALTQGRPLTAYQQEGLPSSTSISALFDRQREEIERIDSVLELVSEQNTDAHAQLERLKQPAMCGVCGGSGKPISGLPCICGGVGTERAELEGFQAHCYDLEQSLERLTEVRDDLLRVIEGQNAKVERLKAEQMEPDEAQHALDQIPDNQCGWPPKDCPVCDSLREKLRRQSDTGAHQEEKE